MLTRSPSTAPRALAILPANLLGEDPGVRGDIDELSRSVHVVLLALDTCRPMIRKAGPCAD